MAQDCNPLRESKGRHPSWGEKVETYDLRSFDSHYNVPLALELL